MKYLQQHDDCTGKALVQLKSAKAKNKSLPECGFGPSNVRS